MNSERITVAVPFVSGIPYLQKALDSVIARGSSAEWRLILCKIVSIQESAIGAGATESYADPRVSFKPTPRHLSMGAKYNRCIDLASTGSCNDSSRRR